MVLPKFQDVIAKVEAKLSVSLNGVCQITVYHSLTLDIFQKLIQIDEMQFRKELQYTKDTLTEACNSPGFTCVIIRLDGKIIAYEIGHKDNSEMDSYYSESLVTLIERKGIGALVTVIEFFYCYENGYKFIICQTEELDQSGRRLRKYWEKFGYSVYKIVECERFENTRARLDMKAELTPELIITQYNNYLA
jgi:hypothetical protein